MKKKSQKQQNNKKRELLKKSLHIGFILLFIIAALVLNGSGIADAPHIRQYVLQFGYVGLFLSAALSGFNILIPIPVIIFFPFLMESGFAPLLTIIVISFGMTIGDVLGYVIGRSGNKLLGNGDWKVIKQMEDWRQKRPWVLPIIIFLYAAFAPAPNELIVIPAGFVRLHWRVVMPAVLLGNMIFNVLFAAGLQFIF